MWKLILLFVVLSFDDESLLYDDNTKRFINMTGVMKTKEYDVAINHYNNSIMLNDKEATTYCNRALAYIKLKSNKNIFKFKNSKRP